MTDNEGDDEIQINTSVDQRVWVTNFSTYFPIMSASRFTGSPAFLKPRVV